MSISKNISDLDALRKDLAGFIRELGLEVYNHNSGQKERLEIADIYERYGHLFSKDLAKNCLERWGASGSTEEKRTYKHLFQFAFFGYIGNLVKKIIEELAARQSAMEIEIRGTKIGYHSITPKLVHEQDKDVRREIDEKWAMLEVELDTLRLNKWKITNDVFREFNFESYRDGCQKSFEVDYDGLSKILKDFLQATESEYVNSFDALCQQKLGYSLDNAAKCDIPYLLRGETWDECFPREGMIEKVTAFLSDLGMPLDGISAIILDVVEREKKRPRAFCSAVRMGEEVYVCVRPMGGMSDYLTTLHELGHACHFAFTDSNLPAELTMIGDSATSEIFAFNFNYLGADPVWLKTYIGIHEPKEIVEFLRLQKLYLLRRYASKFLYELELHKDYNFSNRSGLYAGYLNDGLKAKHRNEYWLADLDDAFYSAGYLRAWIFEVQLREYLQKEFGSDWWRNPSAGHRLKEFWRTGRMYMPEELSELILNSPLSIRPITEEVLPKKN